MFWKDLLSDFAQAFLGAVLPVLATLLSGLVIAWITKIVNDIKAKLSANMQWVLEAAVESAVYAAEQMKLDGVIQDKKEYAIKVAEQYLKAHGFKIDVKVIANAIEAAVAREFNSGEGRKISVSS